MDRDQRQQRAQELIENLEGLGHSIPEIAEKVGVSFAALYRYKRGESSPLPVVLSALETAHQDAVISALEKRAIDLVPYLTLFTPEERQQIRATVATLSFDARCDFSCLKTHIASLAEEQQSELLRRFFLQLLTADLEKGTP